MVLTPVSWGGSVRMVSGVGVAPMSCGPGKLVADSGPISSRQTTTLPSGGCLERVSMTPFFGELGIDPCAEPRLLFPPAEPLVDEDLVDATPRDRHSLRLVAVGLQAVPRPTAKRQVQALGVGQGDGEDRGTLLSGVGMRPPGPRPILQAVEPLVLEAMDPGVDRGARDAQVLGDLAGPSVRRRVVRGPDVLRRSVRGASLG